jgi:hypothetical protein
MVSGLDLLDKGEQVEFRVHSLETHNTTRLHERVKREAENRKESNGYDSLSKEQWEDCAHTVSMKIWREDDRFIERCVGEWEIENWEEEARKRAKLVATKAAENGE